MARFNNMEDAIDMLYEIRWFVDSMEDEVVDGNVNAYEDVVDKIFDLMEDMRKLA